MTLEQRVRKVEQSLRPSLGLAIVRSCADGHPLEPIPENTEGPVIILRDFCEPCRCSTTEQ